MSMWLFVAHGCNSSADCPYQHTGNPADGITRSETISSTYDLLFFSTWVRRKDNHPGPARERIIGFDHLGQQRRRRLQSNGNRNERIRHSRVDSVVVQCSERTWSHI